MFMSEEFKHIDEDETFKKYNYYSYELSKFSGKKIIVVCIDCNNRREISKSNLYTNKNNSIRCNGCQRKKHIVSVRKDLTGNKHSQETKNKIGTSNKISQKKGKDSPNYGRKLTIKQKDKIRQSNKNRIWSEESRKKLSNKHKGKKLTPEHIKKKSLSQTGEKNHRYGKPASHGKGGYYSGINNCNIWMRSGWETKTAQFLDDNNYVWTYEPEAFPITYEINNVIKQGTFRPDFKVLINNKIEYWEIKGFWRDDAKIKFEAFCTQYSNLNVKLLQKSDLLNLGIKI